jgi:hypothetical protein
MNFIWTLISLAACGVGEFVRSPAVRRSGGSAKANGPFTQRDGCLVQGEQLVLAASVPPRSAGRPNALCFDLDLPPGQAVHVDFVQPQGEAARCDEQHGGGRGRESAGTPSLAGSG